MQTDARRRAPLTPGLALLFGISMALVSTAWAVAGPVGSVPDEYMHYKYAYVIWSGQLSPDSAEYEVPETLAVHRAGCYAAQPSVSPSCSAADVAAADPSDLERARTTANRYPPVYYVLVGWVVRLLPDDPGILLARALSATICSLIAALALYRFGRAFPPRAVLGLAFCLTPTAVFFFGGFNPQGLETVLALALLASGLALIRRWSRTDAAILLAGSLAMALVRPIGFAWVPILLGLVLLAMWNWRVRRRVVGLFVVSAGLAVLAGLAWAVWMPADDSGRSDPGTTWAAVIDNTLLRFEQFPQEWVGVFGHLDIPLSSEWVAAWWVAAAVVVLLGLAGGHHRLLAVAALALGVMILMALPMEYRVEAGWGYVMLQARYFFPLLFVALVLLALAAADLRVERVEGVVTWALGIWAAVHVAAVWQALRRYMFDQGGPLGGDSWWQPPLPALLLLGIAATGAVIAALSLRRVALGPTTGEASNQVGAGS